MDPIVRIRQQGVMTLPAELRQKHGIEAGDTFRLVDLDGVFILTPMVPKVPELVQEIEKTRREAGLSMYDLLLSLRAFREQDDSQDEPRYTGRHI